MRPYFLLVSSLLFCLTISAQALNFLEYSLDEGLPQSQVWAITADHLGYIWLGTQGGGLTRYDGQRFTSYTTQHGLASDYVNGLYEHPSSKRLYIATSRGLSYRKHFRDKIITLAGSQFPANAVIEAADGRILVGTNKGLFEHNIANDSLVRPSKGNAHLLNERQILALERVGNEVLIGTDRGLFRSRKSGRILSVDRIPRQEIYAIASDSSQSSCWVSVYLEGVVQLAIPGFLPLDTITHPTARTTMALLLDHNDQLWVGSRNEGLSVFTQGEFRANYQEMDGLPHNHLRQLCLDGENQLWIATSGGGVARALPLSFRHYDRRNGLRGERIYAVFRRPNGELLLSVSNRGLQLRDSLGFFRQLDYFQAQDFTGAKIKSISEDTAKTIYAGTEGKGLMVIDTAEIRYLGRRDGLASNWIQEVVIAPDQSIYAATFSDGISHLRPRSKQGFRITNINRRRGLTDLKISSIELDKRGVLWASSKSGQVFQIQKDRVVQSYGPDEGLPVSDLRCLAFDPQDRLWVAARGHGLFWSKGKELPAFFLPYEENEQLVSKNIYLLQPTPNGLWIGSETGVEFLPFNADGTFGERQFFGRSEGFWGVETCHNAVTPPDSSGQIWFGTMNGLMEYLPGQQMRQVPPPKLHLTDISLFYRPLEETEYAAYRTPTGLKPGLEFKHLDNSLSFAYTAVDLTYPEKIRYRYRLNGTDTTAWSPPNQSAEVSFAGLGPGAYYFEVQSSNDNTHWSPSRSVTFSIATPFWQTKRFIYTLGMSAMLLTLLLAWLIIWRIKRQEARRRQRLETENQLLQLEQKALQLQMNPHFIFNALTSIRGLIGTPNQAQAKAEITNFAALMRGILNNSRRNSISLAEEVKVLDQYLRTEQFCQPNSFSYQLNISDEIDPEEIDIPPMIYQPFVENAVIHGIAHLSHAGQISIDFALEGKLLLTTIQDNGIGREAAGKLKQNKSPGHQSVALAVTRERLETLRSKKKYRPLIIRDRHAEDGTIAGTEVIIRLPVELW